MACKSNPKKSTADFGVFCVVSSPPGFVCPLMLFWEWGTNRFSNSFKWQLKHLKMTKLSNRHESSRVLSVYEGGVQRRPGNTKNLLAKKWRDLCLRPWLKFQYLENPLDLLVPDGVAQMLLYIGVTFSFSTCFSCWCSFPPCFFAFWTVPETLNGKNVAWPCSMMLVIWRANPQAKHCLTTKYPVIDGRFKTLERTRCVHI